MIQMKGLTKTFKQGQEQTTVLKGIDLTIKEGEFVAIMGKVAREKAHSFS